MTVTKSNLTAANVAQLKEGIRQQINKKIRKTYAEVEGFVREMVRSMVRKRLMESNTTQSLIAGKLRSDFGLDAATATRAVNQIINYVSENISVTLVYSGKRREIANFTLDLLPMGVKQLSMLPEGSYTSTGKYGGGDVTWLTWLLTKGTQVVIGDFYVFDGPEGTTRAGSVMQKVSKKNPEGFRVDPGFAGNEQDNFVTRALQPIIPAIQDKIFKKILEGLK